MGGYRATLSFASAAVVLVVTVCLGWLGFRVDGLRLLLLTALAGLGLVVAFILLGVAEAGRQRAWVRRVVRWSTVLLYLVAAELVGLILYHLVRGDFEMLIPPGTLLVGSLLMLWYWPSATRNLGR
jgi:hypothetical protein